MKFTREKWETMRPSQQDCWIETTAIHAGLLNGRAFCPYRFTVLHEHCDELAKALDESQRMDYCYNAFKVLNISRGINSTFDDEFRILTCTPKQKALALAVTLGLTEL